MEIEKITKKHKKSQQKRKRLSIFTSSVLEHPLNVKPFIFKIKSENWIWVPWVQVHNSW